MTLGLALHTHGKISGVDGVRILKLLDDDEWAASPLPSHQRARFVDDGWIGGDHDEVRLSAPRDARVIAAGDVVRLREGSSMVSVVWRRGARTNSLFATERCNSLCLMCSQPPRDEDDSWRVSELLATIPLIDKSEEQLGVTGGEPTLLGDGLTAVLERCGQELPDTGLHVLTNGRNFKDATAAATWIRAGGERTTWAVPLYADVPDIHDEVVVAPGAFDETLDGLYELACNGAQVEIRVVLHKLTIARLPQLAAFIYRRLPFVTHIALMGLEPMGFAKGNRDRLWIDPVDYLAELTTAVFHLANRGMAVSIYNLPLCVLPKTLWPFARQSISEWKNSYPAECAPCVVKDHCAGFFASAGPAWRSRAVRPLQYEDLSHEMA
ncbi:His-Xaa-Ser system radical SAM maturase HxsC [Caulobacter sp. UNC279MFTsu5.1]|uniref:His-Xaa-Ser system radical SAM maturase HxsC n=1 Tax=Caulobacter sp. UNC279MFTsu5.1 TaxID=1502775 RepID=UPI00037459A9|nr:His-Xaa-Ser system radical SAM maturase HxsC [Caulobacter sp. UNC279MFTsu5.1]SFJ30773.1 His-Xaa-Ser system radical SAM maturase HxsC [Caulobacter sp. UNC279MFTsu5.1]